MPNPNAIVSTVQRIEPPLDRSPAELLRSGRGISIELEAGRRVRLDPADPRSAGYAQILNGLHEQRRPVYVEVDPNTLAPTRLLIPYVSRIVRLHQIDEGIGVELEMSHAGHVLRRGTVDFDEIEKQLRQALRTGASVALTEDDAHNIIDVRSFTPAPDEPLPPFPKPGFPEPRAWPWRWLRYLWYWCWWPWWWFRCISATKAQQVFNAMNAISCNPLTVPPPCIPFMYPDDGCWGRAHEMCRLMINMQLSPRKVWINGSGFLSLKVDTKNNPSCQVRWNWHVAPTLCVRGPWFFRCGEVVIDPSLFTAPVTKATWKAKQSDPAATLTDTDATVFIDSTSDPTFTSQNAVLATYRLQLQNRSIQFGPPPYANCP